jgi:hypothetical protein
MGAARAFAALAVLVATIAAQPVAAQPVLAIDGSGTSNPAVLIWRVRAGAACGDGV